jgi:tripartite-type tricarboxylate transporter receptor subunit TctC
MNQSIRFAALFALLAGLFIATPGASAEEKFPSKPIKIGVGFSAGGGFDTAARAIARVAQGMGVTMVVENLPGGGGRRVISHTERSKPDGYTLVLANMPMQLFYNMLGKDKFKLEKFAWVAQAVTQDPVVVVKEDSAIKSVKQLGGLGRFRLCIGGIAGHDGMTSAVMINTLGLKGAHLVTNYRSSRAVPGLLRGECDVAIGVSNPLWTEALQAKKLRFLATFAPQRNQTFSDTPTFAELGYPTLAVPALVNHGFVAAPPGTPKDRVAILQNIVMKAMKDPKTAAILEKNGITPAPLPAKDVAKLVGDMKQLVEKYGPLLAPHVR